jgi:anti-anti-sigma factor
MKWETDFFVEPCIVRFCGDVDLTCAPALGDLAQELSQRPRVIVDVAKLEYADTTFLRFLLSLRRQENKSDREAIRLTRVSRRLRRLLEITGLIRVFACDDAVPRHLKAAV